MLFKKLVNTSYNILVEKLLLNISKSRYRDITLEKFSQIEDKRLTTPYKCFRDLSSNFENNNNFLKNEIFKESSLFNRFFTFNN